MEEYKNLLVQYQGGGYDGCYWEWNFFAFDDNGKWFNVFTSGRDGVKTEEEARELLLSSDTKFLYDLTSEESLREFSKETHPSLVVGLLNWFNTVEGFAFANDFTIFCANCGQAIGDSCEAYAEEEDVLCGECLSIGTCDCCSEYVGEEDLVRVEYRANNEEQDEREAAKQLEADGCCLVCSFCFEDTVATVYHDRVENLRWQALATGTPDIFSEEFREFWSKMERFHCSR